MGESLGESPVRRMAVQQKVAPASSVYCALFCALLLLLRLQQGCLLFVVHSPVGVLELLPLVRQTCWGPRDPGLLVVFASLGGDVYTIAVDPLGANAVIKTIQNDGLRTVPSGAVKQ